MTVSTFFAETGDGIAIAFDSDYPTARAGAVASSSTSSEHNISWNKEGASFRIQQYFLSFDTSAIDDADVVSIATLSLYATNGITDTDGWGNVYVRENDWGGTIDTSDYRPTDGTSVTDTLLASLAKGDAASGQYNDFTSESAFAGAINLTVDTRFYCLLDDAEAATEPTGTNDFKSNTADYGGTTRDPKLVVTHAPPSTAGGGLLTRGAT